MCGRAQRAVGTPAWSADRSPAMNSQGRDAHGRRSIRGVGCFCAGGWSLHSGHFRRRFSAPWSCRSLQPARARANRFERSSRRFSGHSSAVVECSRRQRWHSVTAADSSRSSRHAKVGRRFIQTRHWRMTPCWLRPAANTASRWSRVTEISIGSSRLLADGATGSPGPRLARPPAADCQRLAGAQIRGCSAVSAGQVRLLWRFFIESS